MTKKESYIIGIVMDKTTLSKIAWRHIDAEDECIRTLREDIFIHLADHIVVHSELGLDYEWKNDTLLLKSALEENSIRYKVCGDLLKVRLSNIRLDVKANDDGSVGLLLEKGKVKVNLTGRSVAKLLLFIDSVLPDVEEMVWGERLEIERNDLTLSIAGRLLRIKLDDLGYKYHITEFDGILELRILLPPDGVLRYLVKESEIYEVITKIEAAISSASQLFGQLKRDISLSRLGRWDRWAEPYNRNV